MMTVTNIVDAIGHRQFAMALKAHPNAVSNWKAENCIPAKKYLLAKAACAAHGLPSPHPSLFSFDHQDQDPEPLRAAG